MITSSCPAATFENGLTLDLGYKYTEDAGSDAHVVGALLTYNFSFAYPN